MRHLYLISTWKGRSDFIFKEVVPLWYSRKNKSNKKIEFFFFFLNLYSLILFPVLLILPDFIFYQKLIFTPYQFLLFNVFRDVASLYGTHPVHWYLTQGLPAMLGSLLPLFLVGFYSLLVNRQHFEKENKLKNATHNSIWWPLEIICVQVGSMSLLAHKEFRC
jgi:phosphatidylinositol glycan class B